MTPPPAPTRRQRLLAWLTRRWQTLKTWLRDPATAALTGIVALLLAGAVFLVGDGLLREQEAATSPSASGGFTTSTPTPTAATSASASKSPSASASGMQPCHVALNIEDDFTDGRVDTCKWQVRETPSNVYHEQVGIRIYELEEMLVFDVPAPLPEGADVEIFALPKGKAIDELSLDLILLDTPLNVSGAVGLIANLGDIEGERGPLLSLDGGPGSNEPGHDVSWCPTASTDWNKCRHPDPCDSLKLAPSKPVSLRITRTDRGLESYIDSQACGLFETNEDIKSANLNLYAATGARFRIAIDNFHMRVRA
jgi:hypothetical protein